MKKLSKLFCIIAVIAMLVSLCAVTASADVYDIKKGTPDIDGVLDDMYLDSAVYEYKAVEAFGFFLLASRGGEKGDPIDIDLNVYMLYDRTHIYFCVVGYDDDPYPVTQVKDTPREEIQYQNDHLAIFFTTDEDELAMIKTSFVDEFDMFVVNKPLEEDRQDIEIAGVQKDGHFVIEYAIPYKVYDGDTVYVNIEVADRMDPEDFYLTAYGVRNGQGFDGCDEFSASGVWAQEVASDPVDSEPDTDPNIPEIPDTADASALMVILSAISTIGAAVVIKKRK